MNNTAEAPRTHSKEHYEALPSPERHELLMAGPEKPTKAEKGPLNLQEVRSEVVNTVSTETQPNPMDVLRQAEKAAQPTAPTHVNRELKQITLRRELQQIRRRLPAPQRALSKVIHQPALRVASEITGNTVGRSSGLLGGGLVAFMGTTGYLYLAKHLGFTYNYLVFLLLFVAGFFVGLTLELLVNLSVGRRARD